jgi:hypothetical protein
MYILPSPLLLLVWLFSLGACLEKERHDVSSTEDFFQKELKLMLAQEQS